MPIVLDQSREYNFNIRKTLTKHKKRIIITTLITLALFIGAAVAATLITSPDSDPVDVVTLPTLGKPSVSHTTIYTGETLTIECTLSPAMAGTTVFLYENDIQVDSAVTSVTGTATFTRVMSIAGSFVFHCTAEV